MNENDELAWQAFQYVAGELQSDELAAFEARLADDQAAREAVAEAVELGEAASLALQPQPTLAPFKGQSHWWYGIPIGIALCLATVLVVQHFPGPAEQTTVNPNEETAVPDRPRSTSDLAAHWSEIRELEASDSEHEEVAADEFLVDWPHDGDEAGSTASTLAPDWMMAAVSASRAEMMDDMDMDSGVDGPIEQ